MGKKNVIDWYDFFRVVCSRAIAGTPESFQLGKTGAVGIDEKVVAPPKYNRGRLMETKSVLGIYDRHEKCGSGGGQVCQTLIPIIQQYVVPGAVIHSNCWKAYNSLSSRIPPFHG